MTLYEMSQVYQNDALAFRTRMADLRSAMRLSDDEAETAALKRRIADLEILAKQSAALAKLTRHYYERGFYRDKKYSL